MWKRKISILLLPLAVLVFVVSIWGPERYAAYSDKNMLNRIEAEAIDQESEGYRYTMSNNEKLFILAKCLNSRELPQSELNAMTAVKAGEEYDEIAGTYAFVINHQGPSGKEITKDEIFDVCNRQLDILKELGILPEEVKEVQENSYSAELYSAIDVLEPRNNLSVWKVSMSTKQQNADKSNRLLDAYIDADTGKIYEFYVRIPQTWRDIDPETLVETWREYMGLEEMEKSENVNPLLETTPYFEKYRVAGPEDQYTVVTLGFYEGINELFLKIAR
ncbi:MAG: hypothetical protein E7286_03565 [Lachnospiraceae bacterium]|nr:hypothetical protein [Lachnospiraceae bacterium]